MLLHQSGTESGVGAIDRVNDSGSGSVRGDFHRESSVIESAVNVEVGIIHESTGGCSIDPTWSGRRKVARRAVRNVATLGRIGKLVDHRAAVGIDQSEVASTRGDFEMGLKLGKSPAGAGFKNDEVGISIEGDASRERPFGGFGGIAGEMIAAKIDGEGIGIVDLNPIGKIAVFVS